MADHIRIWEYDNGRETVNIEKYKDGYMIESMIYDGERISEMIQIDISKDDLIAMIAKLTEHLKREDEKGS